MHLRLTRPSPPPPTFKFRDSNGDLHKLPIPSPPSLSTLHALIAPHFPTPFKLKYTDPEGDALLLLSNHHLTVCLQDALTSPTSLHLDVIPLPPSTPVTTPPTSTASSSTSTASIPDPNLPPPLALTPTPKPQSRSLKSTLRLYNRTLDLDDSNVRALCQRAALYLSLHEWDKARADFQRAMDVASAMTGDTGRELEGVEEMGRVRRGLVLALVGGGKYQEAAAVFTGGEEVEAEGEEWGWFCGVVQRRVGEVGREALGLLEAGRYTAAVERYTEALEVEEVYVGVCGGRRKRSLRVGRAMANEELERVGVALEDYREVVRMGGGGVAWRGCGRCLLEIGELGEAEEMYRRALAEDPSCEEAIERIAVIRELRQELGGQWAGGAGEAVEWWQAGGKAKVRSG